MSEHDKAISKVGGSAVLAEDDDDDDDEGDDGDDDDDKEEGDGGVHGMRNRHEDGSEIHRRRRRSCGYGIKRNLAKTKKVVLLSFTKANNYLNHRRKPNTKPPPFVSSSSSSPSHGGSVAAAAQQNQSDSGKRSRGIAGIVDACFCFTQPLTLESTPVESQTTTDPNDPNFTYGMLRALIETNEFYSKECNPHLDFVGLSSSNDANGQ